MRSITLSKLTRVSFSGPSYDWARSYLRNPSRLKTFRTQPALTNGCVWSLPSNVSSCLFVMSCNRAVHFRIFWSFSDSDLNLTSLMIRYSTLYECHSTEIWPRPWIFFHSGIRERSSSLNNGKNLCFMSSKYYGGWANSHSFFSSFDMLINFRH